MQSTRLPRFQRSPAIRPLRLTERDRNLLRHLGKHKFLRSDHFASLGPGSRQQIVRRLQPLYHHGYLQRPRCQIDYYQAGSRPIAYGLGHKGVALLKREFPPEQRVTGQHGASRVQRLFLEHALMVSDFLVSIEVACRRQRDVRFITAEDINKGTGLLRWEVSLGQGLSCGLIPDAVFGLESTDKAGKRQTSFFLLEADRGTMPVTRAGLERSSFYRKMLGYAATWEQDIHRTQFGWNRFRVLTVTTSTERMKNLIQACRRLKKGQGLFLFIDSASLRSHPDVLAAEWHSCRPGVTSSLLS